MRQTIVVLRSKTQVLRLVEVARGSFLMVKTIPIPKEVKIGCGICVLVNYSDVSSIIRLIQKYDLDAFYGIFLIEKIGNRSTIKRIY